MVDTWSPVLVDTSYNPTHGDMQQARMAEDPDGEWVTLEDYEKCAKVLGEAEHQARCDLIDALFYVDLVRGRHGPGITEGERQIAELFHDKMAARYPMQKGRRFQTGKASG